MFLRSLTTLVLIAAVTIPLFGQEDPSQKMSELSLEELLKIPVVTPAAKAQTTAESPAIVSVLTAEQIRDLGVTTLYEALSYLPGIVVSESYFGYTMINIRGQLQTHYNNKVLLMINGHPTREVINGSFHLELVPIEAVKRIEVIRGPGSALYGTNAFAGVINIITKDGGDASSREVRVGAGSFGTIEAAVTYGTHQDNFDLMVSVGTRNDDGYPYNIKADEAGNSTELAYENDVTNAIVVIDVKDFTFTAAGFDQTKEKFGLVPVIPFGGPSRYKGFFLDLKWSRKLSDAFDMTARVSWDEMDRDKTEVHSFPFDGFLGHDPADVFLNSSGSLFGAELSTTYTISENASILGGVVYESRDSDPYLFNFADDGSLHPFTAFEHSPSAHSTSVFGQGLVSLTEKLDAVVGFRWVDDSASGSTFLPRLGLVYEVADNTFLKLLYAEAYRTPDFFETNVETYNVLWGDPTLVPETTENLDLAIDTTFAKRYNLQVNAFFVKTDNLIVRTATPDPDEHGANASIYINAGGEEIWGIEVGLRAQPKDHIWLFANYSFLDGENRDTGATLVYLAEHTFNLGLKWKIGGGFDFKPNLQYVGDRGNVNAYTLINAVLTWTITDALSLDVIARNLSDEDYEYPEYIRRNIDAVPGGPERSIFLRLTWRY